MIIFYSFLNFCYIKQNYRINSVFFRLFIAVMHFFVVRLLPSKLQSLQGLRSVFTISSWTLKERLFSLRVYLTNLKSVESLPFDAVI